jgi:hypothetical protein
MTVSVNPVSRTQDDMGQLAQAVGVAMKFYDLKLTADQKKATDELLAKKHQAEMAEKGRQEAADFGGKYEPVLKRPDQGAFIPAEHAPKLVNESSPQGTVGYKPVKKDDPYEKLRFDMEQTRLALAQAGDDRQKEKIKNEGTRNLSESIEKGGVTELLTSLKKLDAAIPGGIEGSEADGDIPGIGGAANITELSLPLIGNVGKVGYGALSDEGKKVKQLVANIRNAILKARSGGAVSDGEADRMLEEIGLGLAKGDADLRRGLQGVKDILKSRLQLIEAGADPEILSAFRKRPGAITTEDPFFDSVRQAPQSQTAGQQKGVSGSWGEAQAAPSKSKTFDPDAFLQGR